MSKFHPMFLIFCLITSVLAVECGLTNSTATVNGQCEQPKSLKNGRLTVIEGQFRVGSVVYFTCDHGFRLSGPTKKTCHTDGKWSPMIETFCVKSRISDDRRWKNSRQYQFDNRIETINTIEEGDSRSTHEPLTSSLIRVLDSPENETELAHSILLIHKPRRYQAPLLNRQPYHEATRSPDVDFKPAVISSNHRPLNGGRLPSRPTMKIPATEDKIHQTMKFMFDDSESERPVVLRSSHRHLASRPAVFIESRTANVYHSMSSTQRWHNRAQNGSVKSARTKGEDYVNSKSLRVLDSDDMQLMHGKILVARKYRPQQPPTLPTTLTPPYELPTTPFHQSQGSSNNILVIDESLNDNDYHLSTWSPPMTTTPPTTTTQLISSLDDVNSSIESSHFQPPVDTGNKTKPGNVVTSIFLQQPTSLMVSASNQRPTIITTTTSTSETGAQSTSVSLTSALSSATSGIVSSIVNTFKHGSMRQILTTVLVMIVPPMTLAAAVYNFLL